MSFKALGFATLRISVTNVTLSCEWYRSFFNVEPNEITEGFASFQVGNTVLELVSADAKSPLSTGGSIGYWLVDDLVGAIQRATSLGGKVHRGPLDVEETRHSIVQIQDPYGSVIGLQVKYSDAE